MIKRLRQTVTRGVCWVQRMVRPLCRNGNAAQSSPLQPETAHGITTHGADAHAGGVITPLLPLLASAGCAGVREYLRDHLAKNSRHDAHLEAVINLWRSLGHPQDGFWRALLLDYSRIDVSCVGDANRPNEKSSATAHKGDAK
jgi:hypothetical protein